jgi:hypothetical protein
MSALQLLCLRALRVSCKDGLAVVVCAAAGSLHAGEKEEEDKEKRRRDTHTHTQGRRAKKAKGVCVVRWRV